MIQYYIELLNKPRYMLTEAERMFIDAFPFLFVGAIVIAVYIVVIVCGIIREKRRKNAERRNKNERKEN